MASSKEIEEGLSFNPQFNKDGLLPAIAQDADTKEVLMVAFMNQEALAETIKSGFATFYSRSRNKLWRKGEQSGHRQKVLQIRTDCDQDTILLIVKVDQGQCHVGYQSCFYRALKSNTTHTLEFVAEKVYEPAEIYKK